MTSKTNASAKFKIDGLDKELHCIFKDLKSEKLAKSIEINVSPEDTKAVIEFITLQYAKDAKIKGFRPGKVPIAIVKQQNLDSIMSDSAKVMVKHSSHDATHNYKIAGEIDVDIKEFSEQDGLNYVINFEVFPDVDLPDFEKVKITNYVFDISKADLKKSLDEIAAKHKDSKPAAATVKAKKGDVVLIDYVGKFDGIAFEGGTGQGHKLELGSNSFIDNFEEQLIGSKAGDKKTIAVKFPEVYHSKEHAGRVAEFDVEVHEVHHQVAAEVNDEFAQKFGMKDMAELEGKLEEQLRGNYDNIAHILVKKNLFDALEKLCKFDCPDNMYKAELEAIKAKYQKEADFKKNEIEDMAIRRVKLGILLATVASEQKLEANNQDLQQEIIKMAGQYPGQEKLIIEFYQKNPQALAHLKGPIVEEKAVTFILSKVAKNDKKVTIDELVKLSEEN